MNELLAELRDYKQAAIAQRESAERSARDADIPSAKSEYYRAARYWQGVADGYGGACDVVRDNQTLVDIHDEQMQDWNQDRNEL